MNRKLTILSVAVGCVMIVLNIISCSNNQIQNTAAASTLNTQTSQSPISNTSLQQQTMASTQQKTFTVAELAKYNGINGMPAYTAVDGLVYDMSRVFKQGTHFSHMAGQELTNAFYEYHVKAELNKYSVVGTLVK